MNYRKELKEFEVLEAERVEKLRQENADKQRRTLQATQKKELMQLEAKIETERHNMKIKMDKDLVVLQKQINLHVHDIERIQGFVSRLAINKGEKIDELRRTKEKARKTMKQLKTAKAIGGEKAVEATQKATMGKTNMTTTTQAFVEGSPVDVLLFGFKNKKNMMMTSFNQSASTDSTSGNAHVPEALKHLIKTLTITAFNISTIGPDGRRLYSEENAKNLGGPSKMTQEQNLQTRIQVLLDQRKPPTEELPSLCGLYDDDLQPLD